MKQVAGFAKLAGTWTTSSAVSRLQSPRGAAVAHEQTRIRAVRINNGSHDGLMGASSVSCGLRLEQAGAAFQARTGPIRHRRTPEHPWGQGREAGGALSA